MAKSVLLNKEIQDSDTAGLKYQMYCLWMTQDNIILFRNTVVIEYMSDQ